ncbi:UNVERIFIED_CONTAM: hypothetical protein ABID98_004275 [Brevibacillus sp. OAP136]
MSSFLFYRRVEMRLWYNITANKLTGGNVADGNELDDTYDCK